MIEPMYSEAHLKTAQRIFPEVCSRPEWLDSQWKNDEINACKTEETRRFVEQPTLQNWREIFGASESPSDLDEIDRWALETLGDPSRKSVLSVGCGCAQRELRMSAAKPFGMLVGIDVAPYMDSLNRCFGVPGKIEFMRSESNRLPFPDHSFDHVISTAVTYCISDQDMAGFLNELSRVLKADGSILLISVELLTPLDRIKKLLRPSLYQRPENYKLTGWHRSFSRLKQLIPSTLQVRSQAFLEHHRRVPGALRQTAALKPAGDALVAFSRHVLPLTCTVAALELRKN